MHRKHVGAESCTKRSKRTREQANLDKFTTARGCLSLHGQEISYVQDFKYLGRILTEKDSDMSTFFRSIQQATFRWYKLGILLRQRTLKPRVKRHLISVIIHSALLFGSESWVIDKQKIRIMRAMQQRILRSSFAIKGHIRENIYQYPSRDHVLHTARIEDVAQTLLRRRLAFYARTLSRDERFVTLKKLIVAFESPGAETHQRHDGRRAWWSAQLRSNSTAVGIPRMVSCVSHWATKAKEHIFNL